MKKEEKEEVLSSSFKSVRNMIHVAIFYKKLQKSPSDWEQTSTR